jgi:hypothetical protein
MESSNCPHLVINIEHLYGVVFSGLLVMRYFHCGACTLANLPTELQICMHHQHLRDNMVLENTTPAISWLGVTLLTL